MTERFRFKSPEELKEEEIESRIKEKGPEGELVGGIVFEEEIDSITKEKKRYIYIGNPYEERPVITRLETDASREDIEAIKKEIIPMRESFKILEAMARTYKNRQPLLIEAPTAIGKTYLVEKFTEMLYGKGVKPLDFYCSGQTDVSELMVKWVPKVETEEEKRKWNEFLELPQTQIELTKIAQEAEERKDFSSEQKLAIIHSKLQELAKLAGLSEKTQWRLQYGAVPKAMGLTRNLDNTFSFDEQKGAGFILHIEEVGLAEPQIINVLLKLRGKKGQLAKEIQLWEDGGKKIKAGPKFWVVFSTNPPEEYLARNEVDPALARGVVFKRMRELSEESLHLAADYYFTYKLGEKPEKKPEGCILDIYNHPEIGKEVSKVVSSFHNDLNKELKKGEKGRQQRIPLTLDDMARVADSLINTQIRSKETGYLDLTETLKNLINFYYLDRLADEELKETMKVNLEELLTGAGDTGKIEFEGEIRTRKEVFDILVERAFLTEEKKRKKEEEQEREIERRKRQLEFDIEDKLGKIFENPTILEKEKALSLFEEFEKLTSKPKEERTLEDDERRLEILEEIDRLYEKEPTEFTPNEVFDHILRLREITSKNITDANDVCKLPDGTLVGKVWVERRWFPFIGNTLIEKIGGKEIANAWDIHTQPDGTLVGRVKVEGRWLPFIGDTLIEKIGGKEITNVWDIHTQLDGTLAGKVEVEGRQIPFIGNTLIEKIGGKEIANAWDIHTQPDGTLAGRVWVEERWLPFIGDTLIEKIGGKEITNTKYIHTQPDGTLAGVVEVEGRRVPFIGDTLIEKIGGKEITNTEYIHTQPDGTLAGKVEVGGRYLPFKGDTLIKEIRGKEITNAGHIHTQPNGTLAGAVKVEGRWLPFIGDTIIEKIGGKEIASVLYIHSQPDGTLAGTVKVEGKWRYFLWNETKQVLFE